MNPKKAYISYIINIVVFIALEIAALHMVARDSIVQRSAIVRSITTVTNVLTGTTGKITGYFSLKRVNQSLAEENVALRTENDRLKAAMAADSVPFAMANMSETFSYIPASVISNRTDRLHNILIIDKGRLDGVEENMGIITHKGIIGYVQRAGDHYSRICSILDLDVMSSAILKSSNTFGVLQWDGESSDYLTLKDIPVHTPLLDADTVISSGYSLIYPPGIPIGITTAAELRDGINYDISVKLFENFHRLKHVYVAVRKDAADTISLFEGEEQELL